MNLISWNHKEAKHDIRDWDSEHQKMGKGITLTIDELKERKSLLNNLEL